MPERLWKLRTLTAPRSLLILPTHTDNRISSGRQGNTGMDGMDGDIYTMGIEGMTCAHCEQSVTEAMQQAGARDVQASFRRGQATFKMPAQADSLNDWPRP